MITITANFRDSGGVPATGLSPVLTVWSVTGSPNILEIGGSPDTIMEEVGNGFYKFNFSAYDPRIDYLFLADGGDTLSTTRFVDSSSEIPDPEDNADGIWRAESTDYGSPISSMAGVLIEILKYDQNRTRIDAIANTLTVFEDDGSTILRVYDLTDRNGVPSIAEIFERVPQ